MEQEEITLQLKTHRIFFRILTCLIPAIMVCLILPAHAPAVPASPDVHEYVQPDGSAFDVRGRGDEWNNWVETVNGYTIEKDAKGFWNYIDFYDEDNKPVLSGVHANEDPPFGLEKHARKSADFISRSPEEESLFYSPDRAPVGLFSGPVLFILVEFDDRGGTYSEASFASFITNNISDYFNEASYGNVTLLPANEDFPVANDNNGVVGWVNLGPSHPNAGGNIGFESQQLAKDAIEAANPYIDFSSFNTNADNYIDADELAVVVIVAGYEAAYDKGGYTPTTWGHRWCIGCINGSTPSPVTPPTVDGVIVGAYNNNAGGYAQFGEIHRSTPTNAHQATMGIMVHELGHLIFGLPDLYDTPPDGSSEGIGAFGLMGSGSWGMASSDTYSGETPVLPCAWSKYDRGWVTAPVGGTGTTSITAAGSASATGSNSAFRVLTTLSNEYFMVENRQPLGYDRGLERWDWLDTGFGGLAIWHIDENTITNKRALNQINNYECYPGGPSCSSDHYGVALVQADALWHLEGMTSPVSPNSGRGNATDMWYSGNKTTFCSDTTPNSNLWNSTPSGVNITNISAPGTTMWADFPLLSTPTAPSSLTATAISSSRIDLSWPSNSSCEDGFKIERSTTGVAGPYNPRDTVGINVTTYSDTGLAALTEYFYRVIASNTAGDSAPSTPAGDTTFASPPAPAAAASSGGGGGGCFIATAAYGSYMSDEVMVLREFRDKYLLTNNYGKAFVKAYYKYSPPIADVIKENEFLKTITRVFLTPVVMGIAYPYQSLAIFIAFLFAAIALRLIRRQKVLTT